MSNLRGAVIVKTDIKIMPTADVIWSHLFLS